MGIKSDKKATSDQARLQRLTLDGVSGTEEDMQLMIKTITETTGCTSAQAEIALLDRDMVLYSAIDYILEAGDKLDSWTEQKGPKKEKKKSDEGSFNSRNFQGRGGRGGSTGFVDRGGRGRSSGATPRESRDTRDNNRENREPREFREPREPRGDYKEGGRGGDFKEGGSSRPSRGGFERPYVGRGGRGGGSRGGYSRAVAPSSTLDPDAFTADLEDNSTKVDTNVTEVQPPVEESVTATVPTSSAPAPISFAAVAAAAHRKEALRKQQAQNPQPAAPPRRSLSPQPPLPSQAAPEESPVKEEQEPAQFSDEPETSQQQDEGYFQDEQAPAVEEQTPNVSTHHDENVQSSPDQANQAWTNQLKSSLGIGIHDAQEAVSPTPSAAPVQTLPDPGVEFVGTTAPTNLHDYSFGFVDAPPSPQLPPPSEPSAASISTNNENLFNSPRMIPKQVEPERSLPNGDYNLKSSSPPLGYGQSNRGLSYDTSSSSYPPTDRMASSNKFNNPGQLPSQQSSQQPQQQVQQPTQQQNTPPAQQQQGHPQHPQQHMLFAPQMPYGYMNSYMNMYNPMGGVRDDQYAALMQYGMGVDLSNLSTILPQSASQTLTSNAPQVQSGQQRETHGLMDFNKFGSQSGRDQQSQQPSNVGPPPGFQANSYMQQPNLSSLFMQQPYPAAPHTFGFMNMMPNVGNSAGGGRQMYGQDDERKNYDKMAGAKPSTAQNPHSQYQHNGGNLGKYGNMNNKPYNWGN
ncbi:hypothetical protein B9Z55_000550 [Caenorhabditis nigoni]|uniref:Uncharacterized protein n=1 Tax=Caenorhabditis nigoni TaxID=1611254 RepID=A0A2G5VTQ6_9PELO|nr:hypothetical protein B9Z55_000550 [Caenorhabditis nigoni]